jgi:DNA-binding XRE family transcriptional regulator
MESQHMTQQVFAQFIKISPATLSGIFNGRTNPSLNIVEAIKNSLPSISTDWLLFGNGPMYIDVSKGESVASAVVLLIRKKRCLILRRPLLPHRLPLRQVVLYRVLILHPKTWNNSF